MTILGFDTSTAASSAAILRADGELFESTPSPARLLERPAHAAELLPAIGDVMERADVTFADLDAIAVGVGPGTFTGLRIGVATARALAKGERPAAAGRVVALGACGGDARGRAASADRREARRGVRGAVRGRQGAVAARRARHRCAARAASRNRCKPAGGGRRVATISRPTGSSRRRGGARGVSAARRERGTSLQAGAARAGRRARAGRSRTTCASPTRYRDERHHRDPPTDLLRPSARDRDRAACVPDAVVALDVRPGAVEAVGHLPRGRRPRAAGGLPGLLPLRHGLAPDERRGRPGAAAAGDRHDAR